MRRHLKLRKLAQRPDAVPLPLALIVPDEMTGLQLVEGVGLAFALSRDALAEEAKRARSQAGREEDRVQRAYLTGRADALNEAVTRTDTAVAKIFSS
ncbi:hypothetical protein [Actinomadura sp. 9N215]|uniref:hypothetical protein n=1 Tax=Actinomadura sp. 9N215 TaxID=3375150 RepID=UPI003799C71E